MDDRVSHLVLPADGRVPPQAARMLEGRVRQEGMDPEVRAAVLCCAVCCAVHVWIDGWMDR